MPTYSSSGSIIFSPSSEITAPKWEHKSESRIRIGPIPEQFSPAFSEDFAGGQGTGVETGVVVRYVVSSSALIQFDGTSSLIVPIEIDLDLRWQFNEGVQHYYRVESSCGPRECPPLNDPAESCLQGSQMSVLVLARNLEEVCQKLSSEGLVLPVRRVSRFDPPANFSDRDENDDPNCRDLVDVTSEFNAVAECFELSLHEDIDFSLDSPSDPVMTIEEIVVAGGSSYQSNGAIIFGGSSGVTASYNESDSYVYSSNAGIVFGGQSAQVAPSWTISSSVSLVLGASTHVQPHYMPDSNAIIVFGGTTVATIVGTEDVFTADTQGIMTPTIGASFAPIVGEDLATSTARLISTSCCPDSPTPSLLLMRHELDETAQLGDFVRRNGLTIPSTINLTYNSLTGLWRSNLLFTGTGINNSNQQTWNVVTEFGCVSSNFGPSDLGDTPNVWKFGLNATLRDPTAGSIIATRLLLFFPQNVVCLESFPVTFSFTFNVLTGTTSPSPLDTPVFSDGAGLFKSISWRTSPEFLVRITLTDIPPAFGVVYPELRTPIQTVRGPAVISNA